MLEVARELVANLSSLESALLLMIVGVVSAVLMYVACPPVIKFISRYSDEINGPQLLRLVRPPLTFTMVFVGVWSALQILQIPSSIVNGAESALYTILVLLWGRSIYSIGKKIVRGVTKYRYDEEVVPIMTNVWTVSMLVLITLFIFKSWSVDVTPILASAGVAGIILGLAARETISNFFGSIALYADNTYQKGDYIRISEANVEGFVDHISIRSTELRTLDNNSVTIPNSTLHKAVIENKSEPTDSHRVEIEVGVSYDVNPQEAKEVIEQSIESEVSEGDSVPARAIDNYKVFLKEFDDSSVLYRIFIWIQYPHQRPIVLDGVQEVIYDALKSESMEIPYPQRSVHISTPDSQGELNQELAQNETSDNEADEE